MCDCVKITYSTGDVALNTIEINAVGTYNGANYYTWTDAFNTYFLYWTSQWEFAYTLGGSALAFIKEGIIDCPDFSDTWTTESFINLVTEACGDCSCGVTFTLNNGETNFTYELNPTGEIIGGQNVYSFHDDIGFGIQTFAAAAVVGTLAQKIDIDLSVPIVVQPGEFIQTVAKNLGVVTTLGVITTNVSIGGFWE